MRIVLIFLFGIWTAAAAAPGGGNADIDVDVAVKIGGPDKPSSGSGGFVVEEDQYGRVSLTFPDNVDKFSIISYGTKQGPVTRMLGEENRPSSKNDKIALMSDIYLKPSITANAELRLRGAMISMLRGANTLLYEYSEEKLDFVLEKGAHHLMKLHFPSPDRDIYLDITAKSSSDLTYQPKKTIYATLTTRYSLYNQDARKFEMQESEAELGFAGDDETASGSTSNWKMFDLPGGDSLLFISSFEMGNPRWESDGSLTFDMDLIHIYSLNPEITSTFPDDINGERTTIVTSSKKITVSPGEETEIEIPASKNSLLPFQSKETIILACEIQSPK